jgi:hypothetical protein
MKQFSDAHRPGERPRRGGQPPGPPSVWRLRAQKALDSWGGGAEFSVAVALEGAYHDGLKRAAAFLEEKDERELAMQVRRLVEEKSGS